MRKGFTALLSLFLTLTMTFSIVHAETTTNHEKKTTSINEKNEKMITVEATAYTAYCEGCIGITKTGQDLRKNPHLKVIAVDPKIIPLGSRVWVEGYGEAIAGDTGGAIKGNKIDVFIEKHSEAMQWGRKTVQVRILE